VQQRKGYRLCTGLTNPADATCCHLDSDEIGPWSRWQGNLDADIVVVGQDWGGTGYWHRWEGRDEPSGNETNENLQKLLAHIGIHVGRPREAQEHIAFFTNLILCLKEGNLQAPVTDNWFKNCSTHFFKPLIEIINPKVILALGKKPSEFILDVFAVAYSKNAKLAALMDDAPYQLNHSTVFFPLYHCGARGVKINRRSCTDDPLSRHKSDWAKVKAWLEGGGKGQPAMALGGNRK
jgi:DNA polymerase